jgi:ABC-type uncharacterized transport system YnjBCD substrate-binding protein
MKDLDDKWWQRAGTVRGSTYDRLNRGQRRLNVTFTEEILEALRNRAVAERRSVGGLVRHLVVKGLTQ